MISKHATKLIYPFLFWMNESQTIFMDCNLDIGHCGLTIFIFDFFSAINVIFRVKFYPFLL